MTSLVPMTVKGLMLDPLSNSPIVVLRDAQDKVFLPIWVGVPEANAIALQLETVETPRPMTHDLLRNLIGQLDAQVTRIVITELRDSTFFALIEIRKSGEAGTIDVDARPSDAIALALRVHAPIYVAQGVLDQAQTTEVGEMRDKAEKTKEWFEQINPDDLGKYKM